MTPPIRLALIGCGEHSRENLVPALASISGATVVSVCDIDSVAAESAAIRLGRCSVDASYSIALERDLDAVIIAATPQVHFEVALAALRRGRHVFVEKPPTVSRAALMELVDEAKRRRLVTLVGHNLRHAAAALEMQSLIDGSGQGNAESAFGRPVAMEMRYLASKPQGDRWGLKSPLRSFLLSHANHAIDFMIYQMGPIARVNAALATGLGDGVTLSAQFVFASGAVGNLLATSLAPHFTISGSILSDKRRVVHLESLKEVIAYGIGDDEKRWGRIWTSKTLLTGYDGAGYSRELQDFVDACHSREPGRCHPSLADEVGVYDAIDAIERKVSEGSAGQSPSLRVVGS